MDKGDAPTAKCSDERTGRALQASRPSNETRKQAVWDDGQNNTRMAIHSYLTSAEENMITQVNLSSGIFCWEVPRFRQQPLRSPTQPNQRLAVWRRKCTRADARAVIPRFSSQVQICARTVIYIGFGTKPLGIVSRNAHATILLCPQSGRTGFRPSHCESYCAEHHRRRRRHRGGLAGSH